MLLGPQSYHFIPVSIPEHARAEIKLTGRQSLAAALRTARYVNILPVSAVVLEPLPFVAQQHAGLLSGAAHLIQVNGARSHSEARRPALVL